MSSAARRGAWPARGSTRPILGPTRVVSKAEDLEKGSNLRFVVTSRTDLDPLALSNWYVRRGEPERWIKDLKDLKDACFADRLSCHRFWANQFRLLFRLL